MITGLLYLSATSQYMIIESIVGWGGTAKQKHWVIAMKHAALTSGLYEDRSIGGWTGETTGISGSDCYIVSGVVVQFSDVGCEDLSPIMTDSLEHLAVNSHCISGDGDSTASSQDWGLPLHHCWSLGTGWYILTQSHWWIWWVCILSWTMTVER